MSNLLKQIKSDSIQAMKSKESVKLSTLRLLIAEVEKEMKLTGVTELTNSQVETVISRQIKKLDKEIEAYLNVGREFNKQQLEKELLLTYLPKQLSEEEIREVVEHAVNLVSVGEIDNPMKYLSQRLKGKADMGLVSRIVKEYKN